MTAASPSVPRALLGLAAAASLLALCFSDALVVEGDLKLDHGRTVRTVLCRGVGCAGARRRRRFSVEVVLHRLPGSRSPDRG